MRGYQKRVIYLKNTGSRHFEEAYFILREDAEKKMLSSMDMIEEANKIIKENFEKDRRGFIYSKKWYIVAFLIGCAAAFALFSLIFLLAK